MDLLLLTQKLSLSQNNKQGNDLRSTMKQTPDLLKVLFKLTIRRKRYSFQLLKYFVLFPGSSQISSDYSIDSYDRLIFGDDALHSMIKIYEVKQIENKIWGFLNLKALKYLKTCQTFTKKVDQFYSVHAPPKKREAFNQMKQYDIYIQNQVQTGRKKLIDRSKYRDSESSTNNRNRLSKDSKIFNIKVQSKHNNKYLNNLKNQLSALENGQNSESHIIPQGSLLKSNHSKKSNLQASNSRAKSKTKVNFTYTSPSKQSTSTNLNTYSNKKINNSKSQYKYPISNTLCKKSSCCSCCGVCGCDKGN